MKSNLDVSFPSSDVTVGVSYLSVIMVRYVVFLFSSE